jgi:hypothetical protein
VLLGTFGTAGLVLGTYEFTDNMRNLWWLLVMAFAPAPVFPTAVAGLQAQGLAFRDFVAETLPRDARELFKGAIQSSFESLSVRSVCITTHTLQPRKMYSSCGCLRGACRFLP